MRTAYASDWVTKINYFYSSWFWVKRTRMVELGKSTEVHFVVLLAQLLWILNLLSYLGFLFFLISLLLLTHDLSQCLIPGCWPDNVCYRFIETVGGKCKTSGISYFHNIKNIYIYKSMGKIISMSNSKSRQYQPWSQYNHR